MNAEEFGSYIKAKRNEIGLTLEELGKNIGLSKPYLSHIENGKRGIPSPEILKKLATGLNADYIEFMEKAGYLDGASSQTRDTLRANYEFQKHLARKLDEILDIIAIDNEFLPIVIKDIKALEAKYEGGLDVGEKITPEWLRNIVSDAYWDQEWIWEIVDHLSTISEKFYIEVRESKELSTILNQFDIAYNGHLLTDQDRQLIKIYLDTLFANRKEN